LRFLRHTQRQAPRDLGSQPRALVTVSAPANAGVHGCSKLSSQKTLRAGSHAQPLVCKTGPRRLSRYGHTTRFFTICHQQRRPGSRTREGRRARISSCRVLPCASPLCFRASGAPPFAVCPDGFGANHCRRQAGGQLRDES
jgi:hypothetical protein